MALVSELDVALDRPLPRAIIAGRESFVFCAGTCSEGGSPVAGLELVADGRRIRPYAQKMPRHDHKPTACGFWGTVPIDTGVAREVVVTVEATLGNGRVESAALGTVSVVEPPAPVAGAASTIAICMATYDSDPKLFRIQVESIRAQTDTDWVCLVGDDCSSPERFSAIEEIVGDDPRFVVLRSEERLGFYRNFERLPSAAPADAELIALCDHDDRWYPDKLAALRQAIEGAELAYSDLRLVDAEGTVRAESLWEKRAQNHTNLASLLISNTIAGAACLIRRDTVERALPFPEGPGWDFHDHWLALVALSLGEIAYVDRPLYDYVQHPGAVLGRVVTEAPQRAGGRRARLSARRGTLGRWRSAYFGVLLQRDLQARVLLARCGPELTQSKRRALELMMRVATLADRVRLAPCAALASRCRPQRDAGARVAPGARRRLEAPDQFARASSHEART